MHARYRHSITVAFLAYSLWTLWMSYMMNRPSKLHYAAVPGFFQHDQEPEGPGFRAITIPKLGLLVNDESTDAAGVQKHDWERFLDQLGEMNEKGPAQYKLFLVIRHGEGYHNVKEAQVGRAEWERHWARLNGDDTMIWFDAHLTDKGKQQASDIAAFLEDSTAQTGMPFPTTHYTSPLARCLETTRLAFPDQEQVKANSTIIVKEDARERMGIHTCDKRRSRNWIRENYPECQIEDGFSEDDNLWKSDTRESEEEHVLRINRLLNDIFENDEELVISLTAHSGAIRALYAAIGHKEVWVGAGAMVPVVIKAVPEGLTED